MIGQTMYIPYNDYQGSIANFADEVKIIKWDEESAVGRLTKNSMRPIHMKSKQLVSFNPSFIVGSIVKLKDNKLIKVNGEETTVGEYIGLEHKVTDVDCNSGKITLDGIEPLLLIYIWHVDCILE